MAANNDNSRRKPMPRRRRRQGVSVLAVIVLLILALLMGAFAGYFIARKTDPHIHALQDANDRITELENTLTLIGYPVDEDVDPARWAYDNTANDNALQDLSGADWPDDEDDLWSDDSLLGATLPEDSDPVVVAEFQGGQLLSNEVIGEYNDQLTSQIFSGHSADEVAEETLNRVLKKLTGDKLIAQRATELGLTELSEADLTQIRQQAAANYETQLADYVAFSDDPGETRESAAKKLEAEGVTLESVVESLKQSWWSQKYFEHIVKDVTVTDGEVQACYDALLTAQKDEYTAYPEDFEYAHTNGDLVVFRPEGFRAVRDILIPFSAEDAAVVATLTEQVELGEADDNAREQIDAMYETLNDKVKEVQDKLAAGEAFESLMDEYSCSPALKEEPLRSEGFYITANSFVNSTEYVEGSMVLEQPGQVSAPLRSEYGLHLVEYVADLTPGEVPLEEVRDAVAADALAVKQAEYYDQQRKQLLEKANVKYYPERLH
jgi:hypothetical protein